MQFVVRKKIVLKKAGFWIDFLPLYDAGGGSHEPPLGVISHHSVGDAPTNPKFLDFSQFDPYFHLVKSFFIFFL